MRILLFPSAYAPAVGGVEELTSRLARRLLDAGDEVEVWTIRHPEALPAREEIDGINVLRFALPLPRLAAGPLIRYPVAMSRARRQLLAAGSAFAPDAIHVQCFSANGVYGTWLARRLGVPVVVSLQGETLMDDGDIYARSLTLRMALRIAMRRANVVTACSQFVLDDAERFGLPPGKGVVVPNGVELDESLQPEQLELPFPHFVLGLGRIVEKKGFDLLLDAYKLIAARHRDLGLVIAGDGPERPALEAAAAAAGLTSRVVFTGRLSRAQVSWVMSAADVFVLPSRVEPFGIVILEALRAGTPTVVSSRGGASEIVRDGEQGLVVDPTDVGGLARAIERVLTDAELSRRFAAAGPLRAADFDWASISTRYRRLYETA